MIDNFGHHLIPLLSHPGAAGGLGGKESCESAERIHGPLKMVGRFEVAVVPDVPDFFDPALGMAKARNLAWEMIRNTPRLQWVILTRNPELISQSLPQTWIGKGFQNVCIGLVANGADGFSEKLQALRNAPLHHRMILLTRSSPPIDLAGQLHAIDWVVFAGSPDDGPLAAAFETSCREAGVAFLFHRPDEGMESGTTNDSPGDEPPWPNHPFGTKIQLFKPRLSDLKPVPTSRLAQSAPPALAGKIPDASSLVAMKITGPPIDPPQGNPISLAVPSTEIVKFEVVTSEPAIPDPDTALPVVSDADQNEFERFDQIVRRGLGTFIEVGHALTEIRDRELWRAGGHGSWATYCPVVGGLTKTHANRLINSFEIASRLAQVTPIGATPAAESQVRPLSKLKQPEQQVLAWSRATERANGQPTARLISDVVAELMANDSPPGASKPSHKQRVAAALGRLRASVTAKDPVKQIYGLITELETLLKIA